MTSPLSLESYIRKAEAAFVSFPGGQINSIRRLPYRPLGPRFGEQSFRRAADPAYLILQYVLVINRGVLDVWSHTRSGRVTVSKSTAIDLRTGLMILSDSLVLDVFGNRYVEEIRPGEIGLRERGKGLLATVDLHKK